jgi:hypothetical protein
MSARPGRPLEISLLILAAAVSFASSRGALAHANLKPEWAVSLNTLACEDKVNDSFLQDREAGMDEPLLRDRIFNPRLAREMNQRYEDATREYRMRERHDLATLHEQRAYIERMSGFAMDVLQEIKRYHWREKITEVREAAVRAVKNGSALVQTLSKPVALALAAAAISTGQPVSVKVNDETRLTARTNVQSQKGKFEMVSPVVNGSVDFVGKAPSYRDPYALPPVDPDAREERYRVSVARGVPGLDVTTGLSYGSTTTTLTASVSKELMSNLTCVVDSSKPTRPERSNLPNGQESVRLLYGIRF